MLQFGEYFQNQSEFFKIDDIQICIEPIPFGIFERHIVGIDNTDHANMTKYRVTFQYPRSERKAKAKTYDEEVRYVLATSIKDARERIEQFIKTRRMKRFDGVKSNIPKEYLANFKQKDMAIKVKPVTSWQDFVSFCSYIAKKRPKNPIQYFDQHDLSIFIRKYRHSADFAEQLQKLPKEIQLIMKRVYFHVTNGELNQDNSNNLQQSGKRVSDKNTKDILSAHAKVLGRYHPKPVLKNIDEEPMSVGTVAEVIQQAKMYGIAYRELKQVKDELAYKYDPLFEEKLRAYKELKNRLQRANRKIKINHNPYFKGTGRITAQNKMFDGQDELEWDKFGADTWQNEISHEFPWLDTQAKMYDFYRQGMPKMAPALDLWTRALEEVLQHKRDQKSREEEIPF